MAKYNYKICGEDNNKLKLLINFGEYEEIYAEVNKETFRIINDDELSFLPFKVYEELEDYLKRSLIANRNFESMFGK